MTKITKEMEQIVKEHYPNNEITKIAKQFNIPRYSVQRIVKKLNLKRSETFKSFQKPYSESDIQFLKDNYCKIGAKGCSEILNRKSAAIANKANRLGLQFTIPLPDSLNLNNKVCSYCRLEKSRQLFNKHKRHKDGLDNKCRDCHLKHYDKEKQSRMHKISRNSILSDPEKRRLYAIRGLLRGSKDRARIKGFPYNLDLEWALKSIELYNSKCPVLNKDFIYISNNENRIYGLSIDRIDNNKGYLKDNCIFVSYKINTMKNSGTINELCKLSNFYEQLEQNKTIEYFI